MNRENRPKNLSRRQVVGGGLGALFSGLFPNVTQAQPGTNIQSKDRTKDFSRSLKGGERPDIEKYKRERIELQDEIFKTFRIKVNFVEEKVKKPERGLELTGVLQDVQRQCEALKGVLATLYRLPPDKVRNKMIPGFNLEEIVLGEEMKVAMPSLFGGQEKIAGFAGSPGKIYLALHNTLVESSKVGLYLYDNFVDTLVHELAHKLFSFSDYEDFREVMKAVTPTLKARNVELGIDKELEEELLSQRFLNDLAQQLKAAKKVTVPPGHVSAYGQSHVNEDFATIIEKLMVGKNYNDLLYRLSKGLVPGQSILTAKVIMIMNLITIKMELPGDYFSVAATLDAYTENGNLDTKKTTENWKKYWAMYDLL